MKNTDFGKTNTTLFIMVVIYLAGMYFTSVNNGASLFRSFNEFTRLSKENILYIVWFLGAILSILCPVIGAYLFLVKGKVNNIFLHIFLFLRLVDLTIYGNHLQWINEGMHFPIVWERYPTGFRVDFWSIYLYCWYLAIIQRNRLNRHIDQTV